MKPLFKSIVCMILLLSTNTYAQSIENFFKDESISNLRLNPAGNRLSFLITDDGILSYSVYDFVQKKFIPIVSGSKEDEFRITWYSWIDNDNLLFSLYFSGSSRKTTMYAKAEKSDGEITGYSTGILGYNGTVIDTLPNEEGKILYVHSYKEGDSTIDNVFENDIDSWSKFGNTSLGKRKNKNIPFKAYYWLTDNNGTLKAGVEIKEKSKLIHVLKDGQWQTVYKFSNNNENENFIIHSITSDVSKIYGLSNIGRNGFALVEFDVDKKIFVKEYALPDGMSINSVRYDNYSGQPVSISFVSDGVKKSFFISEFSTKITSALENVFPDKEIYLVSSNQDNTRHIVLVKKYNHPGQYFIFDQSKSQITFFADVSPWLKESDVFEIEVLTYTNTNNDKIESYLTLPKKIKGEKPPLIVMPHGGPIGVRDFREFNPDAQYLASQGYAVLQVNYTGSGGFGNKFKNKGMRQWGKLIEDDIELVVDSVIKEGKVDSNRICSYGGSYGGYSALMIAIRNPERYKCIASFAGVTDLKLMFDNFQFRDNNELRKKLTEIVGDPKENKQELDAYSPVNRVDEIKAPVYLAHGVLDTRVDIEHAYRMKLMLESANKEVKFSSFSGEYHGLDDLGNVIKFYQELTDFFEQSL